MQHHATAMTGPEFLAAYARQNAASGLDINASAFDERAAQWARDLQTIQYLRAENQNLQDRISNAGAALAAR